MDDEIYVDVTNGDLRAARAAWVRAVAEHAPVERVCELYDDLLRLATAQRLQITEDLRRGL
jgi:hypothetical protein